MIRPEPDTDEIKQGLELLWKAKRQPSFESWDALASWEYSRMFSEDPPNEDVLGTQLLHALVKLSLEAWRKDSESCCQGFMVGMGSETVNGVPPFLNRNIGPAHVELVLVMEQNEEMSPDARTLGDLLLTFHTLEAFIRPGMVMATFLMHVLVGERVKVESVLKDGWKISSFNTTRKRLEKATRKLRAQGQIPDVIRVFDDWITSMEEQPLEEAVDGERTVDIGSIRNAIAHHDFDISEGVARLNWMKYAKAGLKGYADQLSPALVQSNINGLRGLIVTFSAWETTIGGTFGPERPPDNVDFEKEAIIAKAFIRWMEGMGAPPNP